MAEATPTQETIEKVMAAVLEQAQANENLPELMTQTMKRLRETDPKAAQAALRVMIETIAASMPAEKRLKFLQELLAFLQPS